ncbi:hypothetical protein C0995_007464 [Termitomyces sp. Mi166|nr:hypothetical protein C0995_007464 [Termitomyces sp. Mi166\
MSPDSPIVAFIIGLAIILLASVLNAAGLNLTKLDHVRTSAVPKSARKKDWMRPLWLLGMFLYMFNESKLTQHAQTVPAPGKHAGARVYARRYVTVSRRHLGPALILPRIRRTPRLILARLQLSLRPLPRWYTRHQHRHLCKSSLTSAYKPLTLPQGTVIVILGVIGIVAFGSINSGLSSQTDVSHITYLWRRGGWLSFFFCMSGALITLLIFAERLDAVLTSRADLNATPVTNTDLPLTSRDTLPNGNSRIRASTNGQRRIPSLLHSLIGGVRILRTAWASLMVWITGWLEVWTALQDDKQVAWTLGILWACCGGGLAGGTLVFAKAIVKLLSGSLSKQNPGNQFGHAAPIFTIILLAVTAVLQIICLNRGLKVYDSTLVVPVFYGIYTATGFLDSLIFNNEVDAYQGWTLFLIFVSILILISGVVLLTHKKPESTSSAPAVPSRTARGKGKARKDINAEEGRVGEEGGEQEVLWTLGEDEDEDENEHGYLEEGDPDVDHHQNPISTIGDKRDSKGKNADRSKVKGKGKSVSWKVKTRDEEGVGLIGEDEDEDEDEEDEDMPIAGGSSSNLHSTTKSRELKRYEDEESFGDWEGAAAPKR